MNTYLPFWYNLAPCVFIKIFKPIMAHFRFLGFQVFIFIDDILLVASSFDKCGTQLSITDQTIEDLRFNNEEILQIHPVSEIQNL